MEIGTVNLNLLFQAAVYLQGHYREGTVEHDIGEKLWLEYERLG